MDYDLLCEMTEPGRDVAEGEIAYRIEERGCRFVVVEYAAADPADCEDLAAFNTRAEAEADIREMLEAGR